MELAGKQLSTRSWNPLRCSGQRLPIQAVLSIKLLIFYVILSKAPGGSHTIAPFLDFFESIPYPDTIRFLLKLGIAVASLSVLFNRCTRTAVIYIGLASLFIILWSRLNYSNNQVFLALVLLLVGLRRENDRFWGVRVTIGLLYFGAGLNKLLTSSWQDGSVMRFWLQEDMHVWWLSSIQPISETQGVFVAVAWSVILLELTLSMCFLAPRFLKIGISLGFAFHAGMLVATGGVISHLFFYLMTSAYLLFIAWPDKQKYTVRGGRYLKLLRLLDFDHQFKWVSSPAQTLVLENETERKQGPRALVRTIIYLPSVWLFAGALYALYIFGWP